MKQKSEEMTRHMEQIFRDNQDPEIQARKRAKQKKEENTKDKKEDLGL